MVKIGDKLKSLRSEKKMTQRELAEKLNVSAQAVSRWENDEVEPSLETLGQLATIFEISVDELFGKEPPVRRCEDTSTDDTVSGNNDESSAAKTAEMLRAEVRSVMTEQRPVLGVCEDCNKPLYDARDIVRIRHTEGAATVLCVKCNARRELTLHERERNELLDNRRRAWIWSTIAGVAFFLLSIIGAFAPEEKNPSYLLIGLIGGLVLFAFLSCCFLDNTFVGEMWTTIAHWGFVDMPGVIFSLDFDGIVFLIAAKILFAILGFLLAAASVVLATVLGLVVGIFAFPFALIISNRELAKEKNEIKRLTAIANAA